ncbi:MAG: hypothetical protein ABI551_14805 [Polyangiaceae bacterium]
MNASRCLQCGGELVLTDGDEKTSFWRCVACGRAFALEGETLTDRWLSPLSLALYGVIFERTPQEDAVVARVAKALREHEARAAIVGAIDDELVHQRQPVAQLLPGMEANEEDLRAFLARLAEKLRAD